MNPLATRPDHPVIAEHDLLDDAWVVRGLLDGAPDAVVIVDPAGVIQLVNRQAEAMFGWSREELAGRAIEQLVPAAESVIRPMHAVGPGAEPAPDRLATGLQLIGRRRDGSEFPAEITLSSLRDTRGELQVTAAIR